MTIGMLALGGAQAAAGLLGGLSAKKSSTKARRTQKKLLGEALSTYDKLATKYTPGGTYGKSLFEEERKQKQFSVGATIQQNLRSGIGGSSYGDIANQYERTTGFSNRLKIEDYLMDKYAQTQEAKATILSGIQTQGPSYGDISSAYSGIGEGLATILGNLPKKKVSLDERNATLARY